MRRLKLTSINPKSNRDNSNARPKTAFSIKLLAVMTLLISFALSLFALYYGSRPKTYNLNVSDSSPYDIVAPRGIVNEAETRKRAIEAMAQVPNKMFKSEEVSTQAVNRTRQLLKLVTDKRNELYHQNQGELNLIKPSEAKQPEPRTSETTDPAKSSGYKPSESAIASSATALLSLVSQSLELNIDPADARVLLEMSNDRYDNLRINLSELASAIMQNPIDESQLPSLIRTQIEMLTGKQVYFKEDDALLQRFLNLCLRPNVALNLEATANAKQDAYNRVIKNPTLINRGTRIVSQGDIISAETYNLLKALNLLDSGKFDYQSLSGQFLLLVLLFITAILYLKQRQSQLANFSRDSFALILSFLLPLFISAYVGPTYSLAPPVYFTAVLVSSYFGLETALVMSSLLITAVLPIVNFDPAFLIVAVIGCIVSALYAQGITSQDNFAKLIAVSVISNSLASLAYGFLQRDSWMVMSISVLSAAISAIASIISAIGIMPIFELLFNTISPLRLIELSQPGHPLLKRLFVEAPGTSQHCMMVANLSDAAAEAIGANAMVCRVGAYYHDIGKLEEPLMFTENQGDYNPHDFLSPSESAQIITRHPENGMKLGKKFHLPAPILHIIHEHHGSTVLQYFYRKALEQAKQESLPDPDINQFRYHTPLPSSRESAVVMLADSVEAAMKSMKISNLEGAEKLMHNVFKIKNEQNQLNRSGLSYADVDRIMQAFLQVYAGHFHERVKYPEPYAENQHSEQTT